MEGRKKKASLAIVSVALVAVIAIAGTFAYLQGSTDDVENTFNTNKVEVTLTETDANGVQTAIGRNDYNIIPGTTQAKDPRVTVDNTVDAYVYVKVDDKTENLVSYSIAEGWIALNAEKYPGVYYREVKADADLKTFSVLAGDEVSYSSSLTNEDMEKLGKSGTLTFTAYAIQKIKGTGVEGNTEFKPEDAWLQIPVKVEVSNSDDFIDAVKSADANEVVTLTEDVTIDQAIPQSESGTTTIDLGGKTLTSNATDSTNVSEGNSLTMENGKVSFKGQKEAGTSIGVQKGSSVTLNNVELSSTGAAIFPRGDAAQVNVTHSTITSTGSYCVATNAATVDNYNVKINLKDSVFNGPTPVLVNVPCELNMDNCKVSAEMHGVVVRGGTAVIENCEIANTSTTDEGGLLNYFDSRNWGTGNMVNLAGITIGNKSSNAYQYPSDVTLRNTKVTSELYPTIYIYGNTTEKLGASLTYDNASSVGDVVYGGGYVTVNGVVQRSGN